MGAIAFGMGNNIHDCRIRGYCFFYDINDVNGAFNSWCGIIRAARTKIFSKKFEQRPQGDEASRGRIFLPDGSARVESKRALVDGDPLAQQAR